ncbi:unnamed protein product [Linum trigynum]|uniref:Uncharacterized protein n=1 Tax=Linum trigynum TaxID=586398 RepID=A0AAV2G6Q8_9ROSI
MDSQGFSNHWGSTTTRVVLPQGFLEHPKRRRLWNRVYQPPYYEEQSDPWIFQEHSHYQEEFLPQLEGPSDLDLATAFTGHSEEPCYTSLEDPNKQLRLLVEQFARDTERSCSTMDLEIQALAPSDPSFLHEMEETVQCSAKQT